MDEEEGQDIEPEELSLDDFPDGGLFDPDQTLPYMWGDDPDMTLPRLFGDDGLSEDSHLVENTSDPSSGSHGDSESDSDEELLNIQFPPEPQRTRAGREIKLPARFKD